MPKTAAAAPTVALTGATGFVGGGIMRRLVEDGARVRALTRRPQPATPGARWLAGDLADAGALGELVSGADAIIHCAGLVKARSPGEFAAVNIGGTRAVMRAAAKCGEEKAPHVVLISSLAAREAHLSHYSDSKRSAEVVLEQEYPETPWTILRPAAVYGPGDREILKLLRAMGRGLAPAPGSSRNRFSLIHVDDLAAAASAILGRTEAFAESFELSDGRADGYSMDDVRRIAEPLLGRKVRLLAVPGPVLSLIGAGNEMLARLTGGIPMLTRGKARELAHADWVAAGAGLETAIGWKPRIDLETGLAQTIACGRKEGLL